MTQRKREEMDRFYLKRLFADVAATVVMLLAIGVFGTGVASANLTRAVVGVGVGAVAALGSMASGMAIKPPKGVFPVREGADDDQGEGNVVS